jgi:hypothetical protein
MNLLTEEIEKKKATKEVLRMSSQEAEHQILKKNQVNKDKRIE